MSRIISISLLIWLYAHAASAGSADSSELDRAKAYAASVDKQLAQLKSVKKLIFGKKIEQELNQFHNYKTSFLDAAFNGEKRLVKITAQSEGDMETLITEYYYRNGKLVLVKKELNLYDKSIAEGGKLVRRKKFMYYLKDGKLQVCLYNDNIEVDYSSTGSDDKGAELREESDSYIKEVNG